MSVLAAQRVSSLSWDRWSLPVLANQGTPLLCLSVSSADSRCRSSWRRRHPQPGDEHQDILEHPGWKERSLGCSFHADHIEGALLHRVHHDVTLLAVSRAPLAEIEAFKNRMGVAFQMGLVPRQRLQL